ncbi:MAG TPA: class I SAM-dependent methyltransferase [Allosphingosinicella sp.]|jgi:ubiquinone/menaquinone biosynthesis C-methylase UbiE
MNAFALDTLALEQGDRFLEIGFGGGALLRSARAAGAEVSGVDVSRAMLERAGGLDVHLASAEALPFADGAFDKVASLNSLYFWPDLQAAFAEIARVTKRGGRLVISFEPAAELRKYPGHVYGFRLFELAEVRALMEGAEFGQISERWGRGRKPDLFCCLSGTRIGANG